MACGTPGIAFLSGSVPWVIQERVSRFIVYDIEHSLHALDKVLHFDRQRCRRVFEERFSVARMAGDYLKIYERLLEVKNQSRLRRLNRAAKPSELALPENGAASHASSF